MDPRLIDADQVGVTYTIENVTTSAQLREITKDALWSAIVVDAHKLGSSTLREACKDYAESYNAYHGDANHKYCDKWIVDTGATAHNNSRR